MESKTPIVISLEYIQDLEKTIRTITFHLQGANCYNTNLGLSDDIDSVISHLLSVIQGLSKITKDPSRFSLNRA
jgi:hypothetical protein